jgi:hypothetical protein
MYSLVGAALTAAHAWAAPPPAVDGTQEAEAVLASARHLRFLHVTTTGVVVTRDVALPGRVAEIEWLAGEPVALLGPAWADEDGSHAGEVGRVTAKGWAPFAPLPEATWKVAHPPKGSEKMPEPQWRLAVNAKGEIWQGRCDWGHFGEGGDCETTVWARLSPGPVAIGRAVPSPRPRPSRTLPKVSPSKELQLAWVKVKPAASDGPGEPYTIIRCTHGRQAAEIPAPDDRGAFVGMTKRIEWLVTDPPIFRAYATIAGNEVADFPRTYEGCAASTALADANLAIGPRGLVGIVAGAKVAIARDGKLIGDVAPGGDVLSFAP